MCNITRLSKARKKEEERWKSLGRYFSLFLLLFKEKKPKNLLKDEATRKEMLSRAAKTQPKCFAWGGREWGEIRLLSLFPGEGHGLFSALWEPFLFHFSHFPGNAL